MITNHKHFTRKIKRLNIIFSLKATTLTVDFKTDTAAKKSNFK